MTQEEVHGTRDGAYSAWHRRNSISRFTTWDKAETLSQIDLDVIIWIEYDDRSKLPIAVIETAIDVGQESKSATVTKNLARHRWPLTPAYTVLYTLGVDPNPADLTQKDITSFRVQRIWPDPERTWTTYTPSEWADRLVLLHEWGAKNKELVSRKDPRVIANGIFQNCGRDVAVDVISELQRMIDFGGQND